MNVLHLDTNHSLLIEQLAALGYENHEDYTSSKDAIAAKIHLYDGLILRSRFRIDAAFLDLATNLKFIGRVGACMRPFCPIPNTIPYVFMSAMKSFILIFRNLKFMKVLTFLSRPQRP